MRVLVALVLQVGVGAGPHTEQADHCTAVVSAVGDALPHATRAQLGAVIDAFALPSCKNNVEFSEWGNEVLFDAVDRQPALFFSTLFASGERTVEAVVWQINNPIHDGIDVCHRVAVVKRCGLPRKSKRRALEILQPVCERQRLEIREWERLNGRKWAWPGGRTSG